MSTELCGNSVGLQANCGDAVFSDDNAQGEGVIIFVTAQERNVHQDEDLVVFNFDTRFFFFVEGGGEEIHLDFGCRRNFLQFFFRGRHNINPAALFKSINF